MGRRAIKRKSTFHYFNIDGMDRLDELVFSRPFSTPAASGLLPTVATFVARRDALAQNLGYAETSGMWPHRQLIDVDCTGNPRGRLEASPVDESPGKS